MTTHPTILSHALTSLFHYANGKRLDGAHAGITGAHAERNPEADPEADREDAAERCARG